MSEQSFEFGQHGVKALALSVAMAGALWSGTAQAQADGDAPAADPSGGYSLDAPANLDEPADLGSAIEEAFSQLQEKITVTSGARAEKLADVPMTLSYLPGTEIEGTGQFTLCDTVMLFPGLECRRGAMRQATISTRGLGFNFLSNRLLLLKDGRPDTDPWTGAFYADESMPLTNVKQVEVIRGPGSSLYGSNAFSGVINYITRDADDLIKEGNEFGADGRALVGHNGSYRVQATAAGKQGDLKGLVNYFVYTTDGQEKFTDPRRDILDDQQGAFVQQIAGKLEYKALKVDASYTNSSIEHPGGNPTAIVGNCGRCHYTPRDEEHVENFNANAALNVPVKTWLSFAARSYVNLKRRLVTVENIMTGEGVPVVSLRQRVGGDVRSNITLGKVNITAGADLKSDAVDNQNILPEIQRSDTRGQSFGVYADGEWRPTRKLILGAGVRYDDYLYPENLWRNPTAELSPRASAVYHVTPKLTFRTNYGHAFRAPTMVELAIFQRMYASTLQGNPYLKPEKLDTLEVATDFWPLGEVLRLTGTGFYTKATDFINEELVSATVAEFQNVGSGTMYGVELEAATYVQKLNSSFNLAYQFLRTQDEKSGEPFPYAPEHRVQFRAHTAITKAAFFDIYGTFVGPRFDPGYKVDGAGLKLDHVELPGYFLANVRVGWNVTDALGVSLLATNLFDTRYEETIGFPANRSQVFAELKFVR